MGEKQMSILRVSKNKDNPYVMIDKRSISDDRLSWKAKGILAYCLSMPDDWIFYVTELEKHASDGATSLRSGLKELEQHGYITKTQTRNEDGKISGYEWTIHESPTISRLSTHGQSTQGKPNTTNIDNTNNDNTNNELKILTPQGLYENCLDIYKAKKGKTVVNKGAYRKMISNFKAYGVTEADFSAAIDAMDADPRYTGTQPTSYESWAINIAKERLYPKPTKSKQRHDMEKVFEDAIKLAREMDRKMEQGLL